MLKALVYVLLSVAGLILALAVYGLAFAPWERPRCGALVRKGPTCSCGGSE